MRCPYCRSPESRVVDSRIHKEKNAIKRRRECEACHKRFTTFETPEKTTIMLIKKDGRREVFLKDKIKTGIIKACEKRDISIEKIEDIVIKIEDDLAKINKTEIKSTILGEKIMEELKKLDKIAYVRFASVYREFADLEDFKEEIKRLNKEL